MRPLRAPICSSRVTAAAAGCTPPAAVRAAAQAGEGGASAGAAGGVAVAPISRGVGAAPGRKVRDGGLGIAGSTGKASGVSSRGLLLSGLKAASQGKAAAIAAAASASELPKDCSSGSLSACPAGCSRWIACCCDTSGGSSCASAPARDSWAGAGGNWEPLPVRSPGGTSSPSAYVRRRAGAAGWSWAGLLRPALLLPSLEAAGAPAGGTTVVGAAVGAMVGATATGTVGATVMGAATGVAPACRAGNQPEEHHFRVRRALLGTLAMAGAVLTLRLAGSRCSSSAPPPPLADLH